MDLKDRLRHLGAAAAAGAKRFAQTAPRIEGIGLQPQALYPNASPETRRIAFSPEALFGRISYQAGPTHTRYSTYIATGLTPTVVYSVLRDADIGIMYRWADMCEQALERDGHLRSVDRGRRVEVSGKPFRVQPVNDTPTALVLSRYIKAVTDQIDSFDRSIYGLLSANAYGYGLGEIVWAMRRIRFEGPSGPIVMPGIYPAQLDLVHPKHLRFDRDTDRPMLDVGNGGIMDLPPFKFVFHPAAGDGLYERRGHMRSCIWLHLFKQQCIRDWAVYGALFGIPNIVATYPREAFEPSEARTIYEGMLQSYGQGTPIIVPDDLKVTVTQGPDNTGHAAQVEMIGWADTSISKAVQGETLTTELSQTGSYNIGDIHADTKHAIVRDDARGLASDLRSDLFRAVIELNMDDLVSLTGSSPDEIRAACPTCSWRIERETSPSQRAQIVVSLANAGFRIKADQIREEFGFDPAADGDEVLQGEPISITKDGVAVGAIEAAEGVDNPAPEPAPAPQLPPADKPKQKQTALRRRRKTS